MYKLRMFIALACILYWPARGGAAALPAPVPVEQIVYQHWPEQFVQWIGRELPYNMIELYADGAGAQSSYDVVLTDRGSGKRIHYCNKQSLVDLNKDSGAEAYLAGIQFDGPAQGSWDRKYVLRFRDHSGQPVIWQFIQGSDVSERGGGLSPAGSQPPMIMYREQAAVAGQGSAIKIGGTVSVAELWSDIAQPPFFMPYHGALTENLDIAVFTAGAGTWTTVAAPDKLEKGALWKLKSSDGHACELTVIAVNGDSVTLAEHSKSSEGQSIVIEAQFTNGSWVTRKVHFASSQSGSSKGLLLAFSPGLQSGAQQTKFELFSGTKTRIASGVADVRQNGIDWQFKEPNWLKGKAAQAKNVGSGVAAGE